MSATNGAHRLLVDGGTTNTRAWAVVGQTIVAHDRIAVGARDSARDGSSARLAAAVRDLLTRTSDAARQRLSEGVSPDAATRGGASVTATATTLTSAVADAGARVGAWQPDCVIAAGMITSPLGLAEVPHLVAPAGVDELARHTVRLARPDVTPHPLLLVPGVRCGPAVPDEETMSEVDVMRGEETVCVGLMRAGILQPPGLVLSVGSHWKLVEIDADGRIARSTTTLSGELLHVLRTQTVLAASVDADMPDALDLDAVRRGVREQRRAGLPRAAFCTRLLERVATSSPRARLAFLTGVVVGETVAHWRDILAERPVALVGAPAICEAWHDTLARDGGHGLIVTEDQTATGFVAGLTAIAERVGAARATPAASSLAANHQRG